jgi:hypothetical protein
MNYEIIENNFIIYNEIAQNIHGFLEVGAAELTGSGTSD